MVRNIIVGALAFGVSAAAAGYVWTAFESPFAILAPAAIGWYAVTRPDFGGRKAGWAALVGGVAFTGAFLAAVFLALADGSPVALTAWASATLAAAVAGAATGWLLGGLRGSLAIAGFSAAGMLLATVAVGIIRAAAPEAVDTAGPAQYAYFAFVQGVVGGLVGAFVGAGVSWLHGRPQPAESGPSSTIRPAPGS